MAKYICEGGAAFNPDGEVTDAATPVEFKVPPPHQPRDSDVAGDAEPAPGDA